METQYQEQQTLQEYNTALPYAGSHETTVSTVGSKLEGVVELAISKPHECHCTADSPCKKDGICRCMAGLQAKLAGITKGATQTQEKPEICSVWQEQSKIPYSVYTAKTDSTSNEGFFDFVGKLERELQDTEETVVVNGGHYIPSLHSSSLPSNSRQTWNQACYIAKRLQNRGIDARVSLLINDLPLSPEERTRLNYSVPQEFKDIAENYGVQIMTSATNKGNAHSEKKGANRFSRMEERPKWNLYPTKIANYCVSAIIDYLRDIKSQGATESVWVTPKCSAKNLNEALRMYTKYEGGVGNQCYFDTPNCFK